MRLFIILFPAVTIVSQLVACVAVDEELVSRPQLSKNRGFSRDGRIEQGGVEIFVRPTNSALIGMGTQWPFYNDSVSVPDYFRNETYYPMALLSDSVGKFYIEFYIKTKQAMNLHVDQIILTLPGGERAKPIAYLGPMEMWSTANYSLNLCHVESLKEIRSGVPIAVQDSLCFSAIYSVEPPLPADRFRLDINGINIGHEQLVLPSIVFEQSHEYSPHP